MKYVGPKMALVATCTIAIAQQFPSGNCVILLGGIAEPLPSRK